MKFGPHALLLALTTLSCKPSTSDPAASLWTVVDDGYDDTGIETDTDTDTDADTDTDTGTDLVGKMPWDAAGFWEDRGSREGNFEIDLETADWAVRVATSADGVTWVAQDQPVAQGVNSLDIFVGGGGLIILGLWTPQEEGTLTASTVYALTTRDLVTWGSVDFEIGSTSYPNLVDPSMQLLPDGSLAMTYYATEFNEGADPVWFEGDHQIRRARWRDGAWTEDADSAYVAEYIADPVICQLGGEEWLFTTQTADRVHVARSNGTLGFDVVDFEQVGRTVPFCREAGDAIEVITQGIDSVDSHALPAIARVDASGVTELGNFYETHPWPEQMCSAPVVAPWEDGWVMLCAINYNRYRAEPRSL